MSTIRVRMGRGFGAVLLAVLALWVLGTAVQAQDDEASEFSALVVSVVADSPAAGVGLQPGDVIVGINGVDFTAADGLGDRVTAYSPGDEVVLSVNRSGSADVPEQVTVVLGSHPDDEVRAFLGIGYTPAGVEAYADSAGDEDLEQPEHLYHPYYGNHIRPFGTPRTFISPPYYGGGYFRMPRGYGYWTGPGNGFDPEMIEKWNHHHGESE